VNIADLNDSRSESRLVVDKKKLLVSPMRFPHCQTAILVGLSVLLANVGRAEEQPTLETARRYALYVPPPKYPYVGRAERFEGSGLYRLIFDLPTGTVARVEIIQGTGHEVLDKAAIETLRMWKFKTPLPFRGVRVPITFEMTDEMGRRNALRAARANAIVAPKVRYPMGTWIHSIGGTGRFEFIVNFETGEVQDIKVVETTGDGRLDRAAVSTFRKWRFRPRTTHTFTTSFSFY
jgi:TonB family protein